MTSRERVRAALAHRVPNRVPLDIGGADITGVHVSTYPQCRSTPNRLQELQEDGV